MGRRTTPWTGAASTGLAWRRSAIRPRLRAEATSRRSAHSEGDQRDPVLSPHIRSSRFQHK